MGLSPELTPTDLRRVSERDFELEFPDGRTVKMPGRDMLVFRRVRRKVFVELNLLLPYMTSHQWTEYLLPFSPVRSTEKGE